MVEIELPLHDALSEEASKALRESIFYLSDSVVSVAVTPSAVVVHVSLESSRHALEGEYPKLIESVRRNYSRVKHRPLVETKGKGRFAEDPHTELLRSGVVVRHAAGVYSYSGWFHSLIQVLDSTFKEYAIDAGAREMMVPPTVQKSSLEGVGYLQNFPHHALFVAPYRRGSMSSRSEEAKCCESRGPLESDLEEPLELLAPTVCFRVFESLGHSQDISSSAHLTAVAACSRNEGFVDDNLTRMQSFLMREIVTIGSSDLVNGARQRDMLHAQRLAMDWGLEMRIQSASDPFFVAPKMDKLAYQAMASTKYELQAKLPFNDQWLSCMSFNLHNQTLTRGFHVGQLENPPYSGCTGYGIERLAFALVSQFGPDPARLPEGIEAKL